jgi:hypothetical protein
MRGTATPSGWIGTPVLGSGLCYIAGSGSESSQDYIPVSSDSAGFVLVQSGVDVGATAYMGSFDAVTDSADIYSFGVLGFATSGRDCYIGGRSVLASGISAWIFGCLGDTYATCPMVLHTETSGSYWYGAILYSHGF